MLIISLLGARTQIKLVDASHRTSLHECSLVLHPKTTAHCLVHLPGGTWQWWEAAAVNVQVCQEHQNRRNSLLGKVLAWVLSKCLCTNLVRHKLHQSLLEMFLKKYCLRCVRAPRHFIDLLLLLFLLKSIAGHPVRFVSSPRSPWGWNASCWSLTNETIPCSYPLGNLWDSKVWWELSRAEHYEGREWFVAEQQSNWKMLMGEAWSEKD